MKRDEIVIDIDNVIYDWVEVMAQYLEYHGYAIDRSAYANWAVWEDWLIPKGAFMRFWRMGVEDGVIYGQGPAIEGARDALWYLSDAEWHITLATNRLSKFGLHRQVIDNTTQWLREANIPYRSLAFISNKGIQGAKFGLDDNPANVQQMAEAGMHAMLFSAPHNTNVNDLIRVANWTEVLDQIEGHEDE